MPLFHFDLVDKTSVTDEGGHLLDSMEAAIIAANRLAEELYLRQPQLRDRGYKILVTDEEGEEVHEAPLDPGPDSTSRARQS